MSIFLIGYRGSGKSTVGRLLAKRLGWDFVDADILLEERAGMTIRELFASRGEAAFRDLEAAILEDLASRRELVVATGGGVILRPENRQRIRDSGFVAWLSADAQTLWDRISGDPTTTDRRPNLASGGLTEVESILASRRMLYRETCDIEIPVASQSPEAAADAILAAWTSSRN